ncbi:hypothetical protein V6N13_001466 [Hibiscus sabdariffa]|uniref:Uncharacterized protein n=1 Tax=Hibiscus sabdariffa TaxID=183260 RepID=A0ABR2G8F4_9ROSI
MKSVLSALVLLVLLVSNSMELAVVNGRPLRSSTTTTDNVGSIKGGSQEYGGTGGKAVAARVHTLAVLVKNNSRTGNLFRSSAFKLASGPSKKGPGH